MIALEPSLAALLSSSVRTITRNTPSSPRIGAVLAALTIATACAEVPAAFGPSPAAARANASALLGGFADRFTNVTRTPRYARARELLGRYALTPSVIYNDSSIWTAYGPDGTRTLFGDASFTGGRYLFTNVPTSAPLDRIADGRHVMRLRHVSGSVYEWFTGVDFAAGSITADDAYRVITTWLASAEGRSAAELRAGYTHGFPRTTAALGRLFRLDTLISVRDGYGANTVYAGIRLTPDGIRNDLPDYASYLDRYARRARVRLTLVDAGGVPWVALAAHDGYITLRVRSRGGHFAPLEGPPRPMPDTLGVRVDLTAKVKIFTVGFERLTGEWVNVERPHERGWALWFQREPDWVLPPAVGMFLRSPLRRPFMGDGTSFRISIRDEPGAQTLISRRGMTTVQESAILRFLGRLGGTAMGDFVAKAEDQENRFNATVFRAMREDVESGLR